jgi:ribosome-associated heat shock protein Hsp15
MRFDVALFELRIFKSRSQATAAIQSGTAVLNGQVVKPSHTVRPGDRVALRGETPRTLEILELPGRALAKSAARALVRELP